MTSRRHRPKKSLGQNFLVDPNIQRKIVAALQADATDDVLEIGPGRGALTRHLIGVPRMLVLVELDDRLHAELQETWGSRPDVRVVHADFLDTDVSALVEDVSRLKVVGNIPYNVTAPILFKLLTRPRPAEIVLTVQREVAARMCAEPGTSQYGALTVGVQSVASVERLMNVPPAAFRPKPAVDSSVVRIRPHHPPRRTEAEETRLRALTRAAFGWRRKQFQRILRDHPDFALSARAVARVEDALGFPLSRRPETLSPDEFLRLSRLLAEGGRDDA